MKYGNERKVRCSCNYLKNPESLKISTSVEEVKDIDCSIQDPCIKFFHTNIGFDHASGIKNQPVPIIIPNIIDADFSGKFFITPP